MEKIEKTVEQLSEENKTLNEMIQELEYDIQRLEGEILKIEDNCNENKDINKRKLHLISFFENLSKQTEIDFLEEHSVEWEHSLTETLKKWNNGR